MTISLVGSLAIRENVVRLTFDAVPYFSAVLDPGDASDPARYTITAKVDTIGSDGLAPRGVFSAMAEKVSSKVIHLWTDRKLSPYPSLYTVALNGILEDGTLDPLSVYQSEFYGLRAGRVVPTPDRAISNADLANPQTLSGALDPLALPTDSVLGTLPVDDTGDLAKDEGLQSFKKRVLRRLATRKGRFRHLPGYGTLALESVKHLARPGLMQAIAADAEEQIRQEPETVAVKVQIVTQGAIAYYRIRVRCSFGQTVDMTAPISIG